MAPYDEGNQTLRDLSLRLRNHWHLDRYRKQDVVKPAQRDDDGFLKRRPKVVIAITLSTGAVLAAVATALFRRDGRK